MSDGHLRKGKRLHAGGEAGRSLRAVEDFLRGEGRQAASEEGAVLPVEREDVLRGEAGGSLQAVKDFLSGEGRQAAYEGGRPSQLNGWKLLLLLLKRGSRLDGWELLLLLIVHFVVPAT